MQFSLVLYVPLLCEEVACTIRAVTKDYFWTQNSYQAYHYFLKLFLHESHSFRSIAKAFKQINREQIIFLCQNGDEFAIFVKHEIEKRYFWESIIYFR